MIAGVLRVSIEESRPSSVSYAEWPGPTRESDFPMSPTATQGVPSLERAKLYRLDTSELPRLLDSVLDPTDRRLLGSSPKPLTFWARLLGKQPTKG